MKMVPYLFICLLCSCCCLAGLIDADEASNGYLDEGEYDGGHVKLEDTEILIVQGGGADWLDAKDRSYIEVKYTSVPLSNNSGIYDIFLHDNSSLLYLDGVTEEITIGNDAKAILKGGTISAITMYHGPGDSCYATIYCQNGYTKTDSSISGLWADGTSFEIDFIDNYPYSTANYVNVVEVPEPASLLLFSFGGLLLRRKM